MVIVVFGVGQLVLPSIAAHVIRGRLNKYGRVESVSVSAFPAIELAFSDADTVRVKMASFRAPERQIGVEIGQSAGVSNLTVSVDRVDSGLFSATDAQMTKHGNRISASGEVSEAALRQSLPIFQSIKVLGTSGNSLVLQGTTSDLPVVGHYTGDFTVGPSDGRVVVAATGSLLAQFLPQLTVWSDPKVDVESISGRSTANGLSVQAQAQLR